MHILPRRYYISAPLVVQANAVSNYYTWIYYNAEWHAPRLS